MTIAAMLLLAGAAPAATLSSHRPETIVAYLQEEGFRARLHQSESAEETIGPRIETADGGTTFVIYFLNCKKKRDCEDIAFSASWDFEDGKGPSAEMMHRWNADRRFTKAYLDREGDPILEMDVLFTEGRLDRKLFAEWHRVFTQGMQQFVEQLRTLDSGSGEAAATPVSTASRD